MRLYSHQAFVDVIMGVRTAFKIPTKDLIELKIVWINKKHGFVVAEEKIRITTDKWKEFQLIGR